LTSASRAIHCRHGTVLDQQWLAISCIGKRNLPGTVGTERRDVGRRTRRMSYGDGEDGIGQAREKCQIVTIGRKARAQRVRYSQAAFARPQQDLC
jgi:hypothetical protein